MMSFQKIPHNQKIQKNDSIVTLESDKSFIEKWEGSIGEGLTKIQVAHLLSEKGFDNIDLIEGQTEYNFFRSSGDGTSSTTNAPSSVFGVADILEVTLRTNRTQTTQADQALTKINRAAYSALANKLSKGTPNQYWVERFIDKVRIHIYPTPDSTNASKDMHFYYIKRIQDVGAYTNATDMPFRFIPCMVSGLAYYLSMKYAPQLMQGMKLVYEDEFQRALQEDGSASSTYIAPKAYYPGS